MTTVYPGAIDTLSNPSAGNNTTNPPHISQHADVNDAVEAIETELGINPAGAEATVAARLTAVEAAAADAPATADYLVGTAQAGLSAEIVVGATPGGELGGTWAAPTVDASHSGSTHAAVQTAAETTAASALATHEADTTVVHGIADTAAVPRGVLGYAQVTADQNGIGTSSTDLTGLSAAVTVLASRRIKITARATLAQQTSAGIVVGEFKEGAAVLARFQRASLGTGETIVGYASVILTPSGGAHTYKLAAFTTANTVNMMAATVDGPAFILVEDIGAA